MPARATIIAKMPGATDIAKASVPGSQVVLIQRIGDAGDLRISGVQDVRVTPSSGIELEVPKDAIICEVKDGSVCISGLPGDDCKITILQPKKDVVVIKVAPK